MAKYGGKLQWKYTLDPQEIYDIYYSCSLFALTNYYELHMSFVEHDQMAAKTKKIKDKREKENEICGFLIENEVWQMYSKYMNIAWLNQKCMMKRKILFGSILSVCLYAIAYGFYYSNVFLYSFHNIYIYSNPFFYVKRIKSTDNVCWFWELSGDSFDEKWLLCGDLEKTGLYFILLKYPMK